MPLLTYVGLAVGALLTSTLSGIVGIGGGMLFLPILAEVVGIKRAVIYLSFLLLSSNISRAYFSRDQINWKVIRHFLIGAIPGTVAGALLYTFLEPHIIAKILGGYLILYVLLNFAKVQWPGRATLTSISVMGFPAGFASAVVGGSGTIMAPYLLRYGLVKNAFLGTEAVGAACTHIIKFIVWGSASLITFDDIKLLLPLSIFMVAGSYFGKLLVAKMNALVFRRVLLFALTLIGLRFLLY